MAFRPGFIFACFTFYFYFYLIYFPWRPKIVRAVRRARKLVTIFQVLFENDKCVTWIVTTIHVFFENVHIYLCIWHLSEPLSFRRVCVLNLSLIFISNPFDFLASLAIFVLKTLRSFVSNCVISIRSSQLYLYYSWFYQHTQDAKSYIYICRYKK